MSPALDELRSTLVRLHAGGLGVGLNSERADRLVQALDGGRPLEEAASSAGLDERLAKAVVLAEVNDVPAVLTALAGLAVELESGARRLRSAGAYPLLLALSLVLCAAVLAGAAFPVLAQLPGGATVPFGSLAARGAVGAALALALLAGLVLGRVRVPWLSAGWLALERYSFLRSLATLGDAGVELPAALRASSVWTAGRGRVAAHELAAALDAGGTEASTGALLDPFEARMLARAAISGTWGAAAKALAAQRQVALARVLPDAIARIHGSALCLTGLALTALGATFFWAYSHALVN